MNNRQFPSFVALSVGWERQITIKCSVKWSLLISEIKAIKKECMLLYQVFLDLTMVF